MPDTRNLADELFDDISFSKSILYHWIIQTCHHLSMSVETNLKAIRDFERSQLVSLRKTAHEYEKEGLSYWSVRLGDEMVELEVSKVEIHAFREQVRELVSGGLPPG